MEADWDLGPTVPTAYPTCLLNDSGNPTSRQTRVFSGPFAPGCGSLWLALLRNWESKVSIKVLLWYPYTLYVYDYDNMLWLHDMKICMIMYVIQGSSFLPLFFLLADGWFNIALLVNTRVPATDTQMKICLCAGWTAVHFWWVERLNLHEIMV